MNDKIYKTISKEEYEQLQQARWERLAGGELFYRTAAIRRYWRPAMSWLYFSICAVDLLILPIFWIYLGGEGQYKPYTLTTPVFHLAMGAIVGAAAIGRSWEKIDQYKFDRWGMNQGYNMGMGYDPYVNPEVPYPGSPPIKPQPQMPPDEELQNQDDEIIPNNPGAR